VDDKYLIVVLVLVILFGATACRRLAATSARGSGSSGRASPKARKAMMSRRRRRRRQPTTTAPRAEEPTPKPEAAAPARRWQAIGGVAGLVAALAYSSFLLAGPLGSTLDPTTSYVSRLGVRTQPASAFFRTTDMVAGGLIVVLAAALRSGLGRDWRRDAGTAALELAGAAGPARPLLDGCHRRRLCQEGRPIPAPGPRPRRPRRCQRVVPLTQLGPDLRVGRLPRLAVVTPDLLHDMHSGSVHRADIFLQRLDQLLRISPEGTSTVLVVPSTRARATAASRGGAAGATWPPSWSARASRPAPAIRPPMTTTACSAPSSCGSGSGRCATPPMHRRGRSRSSPGQ
jgi:hypothetical protein